MKSSVHARSARALSARAVRRGALVLGVAGAAAVTATVTAASATTSRPAAPHAAPACATSHLTVWMGMPGDGAAGSVSYQLQFSNTGSAACSLFGFPGVSAVNSSGHQLGKAAARDHSFPATTQVLKPGQTVHAVLRVANASIVCSHPVTAAQLFPPNQTKAAFIPFRFQTCSGTSQGNLTIRVVRHGAGIPGYSQ